MLSSDDCLPNNLHSISRTTLKADQIRFLHYIYLVYIPIKVAVINMYTWLTHVIFTHAALYRPIKCLLIRGQISAILGQSYTTAQCSVSQ